MDQTGARYVLLVLLAVATTWGLLAPGRQNSLGLELCMGCICEATSNCNLTFHCTRGFCGPFLISQLYWKEAGRPVIPGDHQNKKGAYIRCVTEPYCAAATVRHYLARYAQDCNGNGNIDCDDFARIHYMGGRQCTISMENLGYYQVFGACHKSIRQLTG
ncbi:uncharacterized protein LOC110840589 isoform X2 [Zootermopsis nevadensis]|uniref:lysozyme n=1 Tax=Zootermopsis nevadensis TaxID=136037 RepID=A0A067QFT0_ZOONE|nr:uncharacterized protein LOC110840589 isoform X2 [Zootermopsis nevadensis]KDR06499.1 hypothetical protein L798_04177 [Zootermopsis nevadensis]